MDFQKSNDEELISLYRNGNEQAIEEIFERYKNLVRKKAKAMFLAGGENEDLIQEGMIGLYKAVRDYKGDMRASFYTFASMCINRQMITAVTTSNRQKNSPLNSYVSFDMPAGGNGANNEGSGMKLKDILQTQEESDPEKLLIESEYMDSLRQRLISVLSPFERIVLTKYLNGENYVQIADEMGKTAKSIDNAIQRIKTKAAKIS